ncbi:ABC transporter permease [Streptomyces sp. NPDC051940]|uniref:ABC transporter permease n=1 Tax=Streptomyces sp. NPDC051940 TaxID=3155675 RepID=UPI00342772EA
MPGFVFLRVRAHRLLLAAAVLTVLLTTAVLAALTSFSGTVGDAGLRHALQYSAASDAAIVLRAPSIDEQRRQEADGAVKDLSRKVFDGLPTDVQELSRSGPFALPRSLQAPAARSGTDPDLTYLAVMDRSRLKITAGSWPAPTTGGGQVLSGALPKNAAATLKLKLGDELTLKARSGGTSVRVRIDGLYSPKDPSDPYWMLDDVTGGRGARTLAFTTYGPVLTDPTAFTAGGQKVDKGNWLLRADYSDVRASRLDQLSAAASRGSKDLMAIKALHGQASATTSLPDLLRRADRALLVNRSTLLIVALQLILLAGYALLLVARLLSDERRDENELLRARGGSRGRVGWLAGAEALMLVLPAAIAAPLLAGPLIRLLSGSGPLARAGLHPDTGLTRAVWLAGIGTAVGCALAVTAPAAWRAATQGTLMARARAKPLPAPLRAGADVGLLVIAAVAYWQLDRQTSGGALTADTEGSLGVDPVLVAAPALALLAGTVLTLRLLPPTAKLAERRAAAGKGLPAALAGWQLSRRPLRGAGPVLLLVLAVAMGMLAIAQGASWERSQRDQAAHQAGTDIRVTGSSLPALGQGGAYSSAPGVESAAPAARFLASLSNGKSADILALDTRSVGDGMLLRGDLSGKPAGALLRELTPKGSPKGAGLVLPKGTEQLELTAKLDVSGQNLDKWKQEGFYLPENAPDYVTVFFEDRYGVPYELNAGALPPDGRDHTLTVDLAHDAGADGKPAEPLRMTGATFYFDVNPDRAQHAVVVSGISAVGQGARTPVRPGDGFRWQGRAELPDTDMIVEEPKVVRNVEGTADVPMRFAFDSGSAQPMGWGQQPGAAFRVSVDQPPGPALTAIASDAYLESTGAKVGSKVSLTLGGVNVEAKIVDSVRALPTTDLGSASANGPTVQGGGGVLVDFLTASRTLVAAGAAPLQSNEWWLRTAPGQTGRAVEFLRDKPYSNPAQILVRDELSEQLSTDPLGAGPQAALAATAVVAALLAAMGFAVGAAASIRERTAEFAVLRALGAPQRQLARMFAAEQTVLIVTGMTAGLALGTVLSRTVIPLITLTGAAAKPSPPVLVELPWHTLGLMLGAVVVLPVLTTAVVALRRADTATALRLGGE